jgi:4-hydroxy-tetrahydrodipicolinate synthase
MTTGLNDGLRGVFPVVATTFNDDGSIDFESQIRLVHYIIECGVHGLGLFGNAGEGYALMPDERVALLRLIIHEVNGRVPVVVSTGHTGTDAAVKLSLEARDLGADALMVLPPYLLRPDGDGLMFYFDAISRATDIPIMVQDAPLMTQVTMPSTLLARMSREIPNVRYVKIEAPPTAPKVSAVATSSGGELIVFGGLNGQFLIEEFARGARGTMPGADMTSLYVASWAFLERGDTLGAWRIFSRMLPLIRFELQPGMGVSAMKHNLKALGIIRSTRVRHPAVSLDAESVRELETLRNLVRCDSLAAS